ncbi:MAG: NPCBM/NEW2 domain-containing protein, partial [Armatimonadota bacterium]
MKTFGAPLIIAALGGCVLPGACTGRDVAAAVTLNRQWAEQVFAAAPATPADRLTIAHEDAVGDTKVGRCAFGGPLRLGNRVYDRGIGVNSHSALHISLTRPAARLRAVIGLDRNVDHTAASVRFRVKAGEKELFATEVMRAGAAPRELDVPLAGAQELDLIVDDGGDGRGWDQGDWADARLCFDDGSELWLDDLARRATCAAALPFSFVYGGRQSAEFLTTWPRATSDEVLPDGSRRQTVTLTDPATKLQVRAVCTIYTDTPGVDWTVHFTNTGVADTPVIEQVQALDTMLAPGVGSAVVLHRLKGSVSAPDDWQPFDQPLPPGQKIEMSTSNGRSSSIAPFWTVDWGGEGVLTAIGWSGQWTATVALQEGKLRQQAGMQQVHLVLRPGESFRSPRLMQLYWSGGDAEHAQNLFRQTMLRHILPRVDGQPTPPPLAHLSTSFYELNASNEANVLAHLHAVQGLGFEVFWLDAYWTGPGGFPESMGNYGLPLESVEPRDRFPHGLASVGKAVREAGLQFLMWFEPERVAKGTRLAREHPEWVISPAGDGSGLFNL